MHAPPRRKKGVVEEHKGKYEKIGAKFAAKGGAGVLKTFLYSCRPYGEEYGGQPGSRIPHEGCDDFYGILGAEVECEREHATGEAAGSNKIANVSVRFEGCTAFGLPATSPGLPAGEIQVNPLKGELVYYENEETHAKKQVGVLLEPVAAGSQFAEFEIFEGETRQHVGEGNPTEGAFYEEAHGAPTGNDGVMSPIEPVDQMTHTFTQNYREKEINPYEPVSCHVSPSSCPGGDETEFGAGQTDGDDLNVPSHLEESGKFEALESYQENPGTHETTSLAPAGEEITNVNTLEGEAEIKG